jgi:hypothetical protein
MSAGKGKGGLLRRSRGSAGSLETATTDVSNLTDGHYSWHSRASVGAAAADGGGDADGDAPAPPTTTRVAPAAATSKRAAKATWRQRLMCGLPACYYDPVDSLLLDVHDDNADSAAAMGRCDNILFQQTVCADIDGNSLFINGDDDDDSSQSSSELGNE